MRKLLGLAMYNRCRAGRGTLYNDCSCVRALLPAEAEQPFRVLCEIRQYGLAEKKRHRPCETKQVSGSARAVAGVAQWSNGGPSDRQPGLQPRAPHSSPFSLSMAFCTTHYVFGTCCLTVSDVYVLLMRDHLANFDHLQDLGLLRPCLELCLTASPCESATTPSMKPIAACTWIGPRLWSGPSLCLVSMYDFTLHLLTAFRKEAVCNS